MALSLPIATNDTHTSATYKKYLFESVFSQTKFSTHYVIQLVFSTIITTLGLLTNNTVVVIGAMLISPLFWPVMGIALGILTTRQNVLKNSIFSFLISFALVVAFSSIVALFIPFTDLPGEVTARINPNIIDLFIALFTSMIGVLALYYPTISATATGVAISISLLPPLCVFGIGLSRLMFDVMWKSLLLFGTNVGAIIFIGVVVLYILKIRPKKGEEEKIFKYGVLMSGILMILLSLPLSFYLRQSMQQNAISNQIEIVIDSEIKNFNKDAKVEAVHVDFLSFSNKLPLEVEAKIYLPEGHYFTQSQLELLLDKLSAVSEREVSLKFNILSTLSIQSDQDIERSKLRESIRELIVMEFAPYTDSVAIDKISIAIGDNLGTAEVLIQIKKFGDTSFNKQSLFEMEQFVESKLNIEAAFEVELIPISKIEDNTLFETLVSGLSKIFDDQELSDPISSLKIDEYIVHLDLSVPTDFEYTEELKIEVDDYIKSNFESEVEVKTKLVRYEVL